jgi:hypothetical protein
MDVDVDSLQTQDEHDVSSYDFESSQPPRKRARRCAVAAFVSPGQRVYPQSAYFGSPAHTRSISAKPENEVLSDFLVLPFWIYFWLVVTVLVGRDDRGGRRR